MTDTAMMRLWSVGFASARRLVKIYKHSQELNEELGAYILEKKPNLKVKLKDPELDIKVEIFKSKALIYTSQKKGIGGLPVGASGEVFIRVKDKLKSTVVAFLLLKRGIIPSLSKELEELKKFELGFKIKVRDELDKEVVASDETLENLRVEKESKFVLKPLVGFKEEEIKKLYSKIKEL